MGFTSFLIFTYQRHNSYRELNLGSFVVIRNIVVQTTNAHLFIYTDNT